MPPPLPDALPEIQPLLEPVALPTPTSSATEVPATPIAPTETPLEQNGTEPRTNIEDNPDEERHVPPPIPE